VVSQLQLQPTFGWMMMMMMIRLEETNSYVPTLCLTALLCSSTGS